jgi:hypothetical protein
MRYPLTLILLSCLVTAATAQDAAKIKPKKGRPESPPPAVKTATAPAYPFPILPENIAATATIGPSRDVEVVG